MNPTYSYLYAPNHNRARPKELHGEPFAEPWSELLGELLGSDSDYDCKMKPELIAMSELQLEDNNMAANPFYIVPPSRSPPPPSSAIPSAENIVPSHPASKPAALQIPRGTSAYYCGICKVDCASPINFQAHIESRKHGKKVDGLKFLGYEVPSHLIPVAAIPQTESMLPSHGDGDDDLIIQSVVYSASGLSSRAGEPSPLPIAPIPVSSLTLNPNPVPAPLPLRNNNNQNSKPHCCTTCNIYCSDSNALLSHFRGAKHQKASMNAFRAHGLQSFTGTIPNTTTANPQVSRMVQQMLAPCAARYCPICRIDFADLDAYTRHLSQPMHLSKSDGNI